MNRRDSIELRLWRFRDIATHKEALKATEEMINEIVELFKNEETQ